MLDTCAFVPREVRELADAIGDRIGQYTLVSSLSVHPDDLPVGATEDTAIHPPPYPDTEDVTEETYGPLKVACEVEAAAAFADRLLVIRPGYIVGPHDPTDRFTWWVRRAAAGGEMFAAGPPDAPIQGIDARDLGAFVLDRIEAKDSDTYGVVGPAEPATTADVVEGGAGRGGRRHLVRVGRPHVRARARGGSTRPGSRCGTPTCRGSTPTTPRRRRPRDFVLARSSETIADTLAWDRRAGAPPLAAGVPPGKERELLDAWRARAS